MSAVRRSIELGGTPLQAEALWYDVQRWPAWVDGFGQVVERRDPWPDPGGVVVWTSSPYGRGRVTERVTSRRPGAGQDAEVDDDRITATQSLSFAPAPGGAEVTLSLDYRIKRSYPGIFLVDLLFIRRAMGDSLRRTLEAFGRELRSSA